MTGFVPSIAFLTLEGKNKNKNPEDSDCKINVSSKSRTSWKKRKEERGWRAGILSPLCGNLENSTVSKESQFP